MRSPDALARGQAAGYARLASSKSWTASWLFSAAAFCAPRVSRSTLARACANSSASPSHHSASDAIASSARSGCPWTYSARYSANDATTRACRRASSGCMASGQLKPVGVCVDILRSPLPSSIRVCPKPRNRKRLLPNRSKGDYVDEGIESCASRDGRRGRRESRSCLGVSRLPFLPAGSPAFWGGEDSLGSYPQCRIVVKRTRSAVSPGAPRCPRSAGARPVCPVAKHDRQCVHRIQRGSLPLAKKDRRYLPSAPRAGEIRHGAALVLRPVRHAYLLLYPIAAERLHVISAGQITYERVWAGYELPLCHTSRLWRSCGWLSLT